MDRTKLLIGSLCVLAFIVLIVVFLLLQESKEITVEEGLKEKIAKETPPSPRIFTEADIQECNKLEMPEKRNTCLFDLGREGYEPACESLGGEIQEACFWAVALDSNQPEHCKKIKNIDTQQDCVASLFEAKGLVGCAALTGEYAAYTRGCYISVFLSQTIKEEDCKIVPDANLKAYCIAITQKNPDNCKLIEGTLADNCFFDMASKLKKAEVCESIADIDEKDMCFFNLVIEGSDKAICQKIINQTRREECEKI